MNAIPLRTMTVQTLREILDKYPDDMPVLVSGEGSGYELIDGSSLGPVEVGQYRPPISSEVDVWYNWDEDLDLYDRVTALIIPR